MILTLYGTSSGIFLSMGLQLSLERFAYFFMGLALLVMAGKIFEDF